MKKLNIEKLHRTLNSLNIKINGISEAGIVWDENNNEIQDLPEIQSLIEAHDPTEEVVESTEERIKKLEEKLNKLNK